jgi:hypothetical protein
MAWFAARVVRATRPLRQRIRLPIARLALCLRRARHHTEEDPSLSSANERQDRTVPPHPRRRLGSLPPLQHRVSPPRSTTGMAPRIQLPQAPHRRRSQTTHQCRCRLDCMSSPEDAGVCALPFDEASAARSSPPNAGAAAVRYTGYARPGGSAVSGSRPCPMRSCNGSSVTSAPSKMSPAPKLRSPSPIHLAGGAPLAV